MAAIDLFVLGILKKANYDIQKLAEYRNISKRGKSAPSIYKKVSQPEEKGFLKETIVKDFKSLSGRKSPGKRKRAGNCENRHDRPAPTAYFGAGNRNPDYIAEKERD